MYIMLRRQIRNKALQNLFLKTYSNKKKTYYEIFNLPYDCTDNDIKEAFTQMTKKYHPDINKDAGAQEYFMHIVKAYNVLRNPSSRRSYNNEIQISNDFKSNPTETKIDPRFKKINNNEKRSRIETILVFLSSTALLIYCLYDVVRLLCPVCEVPGNTRTRHEKIFTQENLKNHESVRLEDIEAAAAQLVILKMSPELVNGKKQYRCVCGKVLSDDQYTEILTRVAPKTSSHHE